MQPSLLLLRAKWCGFAIAVSWLGTSTAVSAQPQPAADTEAQEPASDEEGTGRVAPPKLLRYEEPTAPSDVVLKEAVSVVLELTIDAAGAVTAVRVFDAALDPRLAAAATEAAKRFAFEPARLDGTAIEVVIEYELWFRPAKASETKREAATSPDAPVAEGEGTRSDTDEAHGAVPRQTDIPREPLFEEEVFQATAEVEKPQTQPTERSLQGERLTRTPGSRGDPIRAVELLPGVSRAPMGQNPILRGSNGHESAMFLDGIPIPELYHFGGLTSVVQPLLLREVTLTPGNFSARYGRATGGIIDAKLRSPRSDGFHALLDVNLVDSSAMVESPVSDQAAVALAARRSNIDFVFETLVPEDAFSVVAAPVYWDYQGLFETRPNEESRLTATITGSSDTLKFVFDEPNQEDPTLTGELSGKLEHHTLTLGYHYEARASEVHLQAFVGRDQLEQKVGSYDAYFDAARLGGRAEWDVELREDLRLLLGGDAIGTISKGAYRGPAAPAQEGSLGAPDTTSGLLVVEESAFTQFSPALYGELSWFVVPRWTVVPGVRLDLYEDLDALTLNPRLNQRFALSDQTTLKGGVGAYSQRPVWHESLPEVGNPEIQPYHSLHVSLGAEHRFEDWLRAEVDGFYKYLYDRVVATEGGVAPHFENDGEGRVVGLETQVVVEPPDIVRGYVSYTLSRSERRDRAEPYRLFDNDQTHVLNVALSRELGAGFELGGRLRWVSGNPTTPVTGAVYDAVSDSYQPRYGAQNSERDPAFRQLDLRLDKRFDLGAVDLGLYLEVLNVTNAENREGYSYSYDYSRKEGATGMPFFPNLGVRGEL